MNISCSVVFLSAVIAKLVFDVDSRKSPLIFCMLVSCNLFQHLLIHTTIT